MANDPIYERTINLPFGYVFVARATPSSVKRTVIALLPWAIVAMLPGKTQTSIATSLARRFSPLAKYKIK